MIFETVGDKLIREDAYLQPFLLKMVIPWQRMKTYLFNTYFYALIGNYWKEGELGKHNIRDEEHYQNISRC